MFIEEFFFFRTTPQPVTLKDTPTVQYDLLTENISESLFANLFPIKKSK